MNYLAHIYLSGENDDVMLGNFMADAVKGSTYKSYPEAVQKGILLHRFIDDFTDTHPVVHETKKLFRPVYHKLSPILVDILYDHYLAKNWHKYHNAPLEDFVVQQYAKLQMRLPEMPDVFQHILPAMVAQNWLVNYKYQHGIERTLQGMSKRVTRGAVLAHGWADLQPVYQKVETQFEVFFAELINAVDEKLNG